MVLTIKNFSNPVGPGVVETAPTNLVGVAGTIKATLTWTSATGESGVLWTEEKLVRKEGSAPQGSMDGTLVTTITTKDTYASTGYEDTGLDSTKTYYYKVFAIYDNGTEMGSSDVNVTPNPWTPGANTLAYYPLKSDFNDYSGNGKDGTVTGNYIFQTNSCYFDLGYVNIPAPTGAKTTGEMTMSVWVKMGTPIGGGPRNKLYGYIIGQWYESNDSKSATGMRYYRPSLSSTTRGPLGSGLDNDQFYNVVCLYKNGSDTINVYVNGTYLGIYTSPQMSDFSKIGNANWYINYFNNGWSVKPTIGDAIIEDRNRTAQEILDYYNAIKNEYGYT